jgi:predicted porin
MKKTLIALAALAATSAFAQSTVTIFGAIDAGYKNVNNSATSAGNSQNITLNNSATSLIIFKGVEDMGGGMAATFLMELDFNPVNSSSQNAAPNGAGGANFWNGTPFNGEQYVGISGGFGNLQLGTPNADGLIAGIIATPFGTAMGSGFNGTFGRLGTQPVASLNQYDGQLAGNARIIRHANTVQYTTPNFSGFTVTGGYAFGNDNNPAVTLAGNTNTYTTLSLKYNNGPINAMYVYTKEAAASNGANGTFLVVANPALANTGVLATTTTPTLPANSDVTWNQLSANYTFGAATVYGGWSSTKQSSAVPLEDSTSWNLAGQYLITPSIKLQANYLVRTSNVANVARAGLLGLGAEYAFSKRTNAYFRYEGINFDSTALAASSSLNSWAVGLKHTF